MIVLRILRIILPPFHPIKYKWIEYWYGKQSNKSWKYYTNDYTIPTPR